VALTFGTDLAPAGALKLTNAEYVYGAYQTLANSAATASLTSNRVKDGQIFFLEAEKKLVKADVDFGRDPILLLEPFEFTITGSIQAGNTATASFGRFEGDGSGLSGVSAGSVAFNTITGKPTLISSSAQFVNDNVVFNSVSASGNIVTQGDVIAENYIVKSTVTAVTTSFSSGSTRFGNSADDLHEFTGSLSLDSSAFKYGASTWNESSGVNEFTGSSWSFKSTKGSGDLFKIVDNNNNLVFKGTQSKLLVFGAVQGGAPSAVAGGLYYSGSDEWFLGYENQPA